MKRGHIIAVVYLLSLSTHIFAPISVHAASGTEAASFLEIPVGAEPAAMGSAYTALAGNAYAPVWNPAGLGSIDAVGIAGQHLSYLASIHDEFASAVIPLGAGRGIGFSAQYLGTGDIAGTNPDGTPIGNYSAYYAAYSLAYGERIGDKLSLGVSGKWINAQISDVSANAFGGDAGALYRWSERLRAAFTVTDLGTKLKFTDQADALPLAYHLGLAFDPRTWCTVSLEGVQTQNGETSARMGVEWRPVDLIALRAGYRSDALRSLSAEAGVSAGVGLRFWGQEFAYAWVPYGDLGDTQYFSFVLKFGGNPDRKVMKKRASAGSSEVYDDLFLKDLEGAAL